MALGLRARWHRERLAYRLLADFPNAAGRDPVLVCFAALKHRFFDRDGANDVLSRMSWGDFARRVPGPALVSLDATDHQDHADQQYPDAHPDHR